jgi:hypothetical protein
MSNLLDPAFWLFLALGWGFALITILISWRMVEHGLAEVTRARRERDEYALQVRALKQTLAAFPSEWHSIYIGLRKVALENISDGKSLMRRYEQGVRRHSRYHDIEMVFPEMSLPPELESPEPPPLPQLEAPEGETEDKEMRQ